MKKKESQREKGETGGNPALERRSKESRQTLSSIRVRNEHHRERKGIASELSPREKKSKI